MPELQVVTKDYEIMKGDCAPEQSDTPIRGCSSSKIIRRVSISVFAGLFLAGFIFGALNPIHKVYSEAQATLVLIANGLGLVCLAIPYLLRKIFRLNMSLTIVLLWWTFILCHSLGETFEFYYKISGWDKALHLTAGVLQFVSFFGIARSYLANKSIDKKVLLSVVFAIIASLAVACLWEIIEFTIDSLFGTNMQKFIPTEFFNGGNTFSELNGAAEEIASFYSSPSGYKFALIDTMLDCVSCLIGTVLGTLLTAAITRKKSDFLERAFVIQPRSREITNT